MSDVLHLMAAGRLDVRRQITGECLQLTGGKNPDETVDIKDSLLENLSPIHMKTNLSRQRVDLDRLRPAVFQVNRQFHLLTQAGLLRRNYEQACLFAGFSPFAGQTQQGEIDVVQPEGVIFAVRAKFFPQTAQFRNRFLAAEGGQRLRQSSFRIGVVFQVFEQGKQVRFGRLVAPVGQFRHHTIETFTVGHLHQGGMQCRANAFILMSAESQNRVFSLIGGHLKIGRNIAQQSDGFIAAE